MGFPDDKVIKNLPLLQEMQETWVRSLGQEDPWRRKWQPSPVILPGKTHRQRSPPMVLGVTKRWTRLKWLSTHAHWMYISLTDKILFRLLREFLYSLTIPWESWAPKNWCFWTVVLEKTLESPLDCKEIQPVHPQGDQSWVFIGRPDAKAETPILWPPHAKSWLIGKDSDAGRDWGQEEKGTTEDKMAGWHHRLDGCEFEWTPGVGDGQGGLACCDSWGCKESDTTEWLNWTDTLIWKFEVPIELEPGTFSPNMEWGS